METIIGFQRVAAIGDEIDNTLPGLPVETGIRRGADDFFVELVQSKPHAARSAHNVLGEHIQRSTTNAFAVHLAILNGSFGGAAFQDFKSVGRHEHRLARLIHAVIGAPDPLHQPGGSFRRAHLDDEIDLAPVDPEIERGGTHHRLDRT